MGSSPFTATMPSSQQRLLDTLRSFLVGPSAPPPGSRLLVAFSAGPDSTALLWALTLLAPKFSLAIHAAHLDHRLDPDSARRARHAQKLAKQLRVPLALEHLASPLPAGTSSEVYARRARYRFLRRVADELGIHSILTAHHADDQAETLILRWLFGSGLFGLGGIQPRRGRLARPLLNLRRETLHHALASSGLTAVEDPTNLAPRQPRSRVRHHLLPTLTDRVPRLVPRLGHLADATRRVGERLDHLLRKRLHLERRPRGASFDRTAFQELPAELQPQALALLAREASAPYPPSAQARRELLCQLDRGDRVGCDCGHGFRFVADRRTLRLVRSEPSMEDFAYTLGVPGTETISELARTVHLEPGPVAPWMFQGHPDRVGFWCPDLASCRVTIRNRRPGDSIRPLGSNQHRRLNDMLINSCIPREERDSLPLLVIDEEIAWVPGLTLCERFRLPTDAQSVWIATLEDLGATPEDPDSHGFPERTALPQAATREKGTDP